MATESCKVLPSSKQTSNQNSARLDFDDGAGGKSKEDAKPDSELEDGEILSDSDENAEETNNKQSDVIEIEGNEPETEQSYSAFGNSEKSSKNSRKKRKDKGSDNLDAHSKFEKRHPDSDARRHKRKSGGRHERKSGGSSHKRGKSRDDDELIVKDDRKPEKKPTWKKSWEPPEPRPLVPKKIEITDKSGPDNMLSLDLIQKARSQGVKTVHIPVQPRMKKMEEEQKKKEDVTKKLGIETTLKSLIPESKLKKNKGKEISAVDKVRDDDDTQNSDALQRNYTEALKMKAMRQRQKNAASRFIQPEFEIVEAKSLHAYSTWDTGVKQNQSKPTTGNKKAVTKDLTSKEPKKIAPQTVTTADANTEKKDEIPKTAKCPFASKMKASGSDISKKEGEVNLVGDDDIDDANPPPLPVESLPAPPEELPEGDLVIMEEGDGTENNTDQRKEPDTAAENEEPLEKEEPKSSDDLSIDKFGELLYFGDDSDGGSEDIGNSASDKEEFDLYSMIFTGDSAGDNGASEEAETSNVFDDGNMATDSDLDRTLIEEDSMTSSPPQKRKRSRSEDESSKENQDEEGIESEVPPQKKQCKTMEEEENSSSPIEEEAAIQEEAVSEEEAVNEEGTLNEEEAENENVANEENVAIEDGAIKEEGVGNEEGAVNEEEIVNEEEVDNGDAEVAENDAEEGEVEDGEEDGEESTEMRQTRELDIIDDIQGDDQEDYELEDGEISDDEMLDDSELHAMLEEGVDKHGHEIDDDEPIYRAKVVLDEKGVDPFELLPEGWVVVTHNCGMPVYLHKTSRVCSMSKPYFLGPGSVRKHDIPLSAIPCLHYGKALKQEKEGDSTKTEGLVNGVATSDSTVHKDDGDQSQSERSGLQIMDESGKLVPLPVKVECAEESQKQKSLSVDEVRNYCKELFLFKTITVKKFKSWKTRRKHLLKQRHHKPRPTLPSSAKLIKCTVPQESSHGEEKRTKKKEFVLNPMGKSYVCVLHEYAQHTLKLQPKYLFRELENAQTPYSATVLINDIMYGTGYASSKKSAKMEAAKNTLSILIPEMTKVMEETANEQEDLTFFDTIKIEDPRVYDLCNKAGQHSPYQILLECLKRNFGMGDTNCRVDVKPLKHQKSEYSLSVGKHSVSVVCKNKREGKQRAAQAMLQTLHPHIYSLGALLRLYGKSSWKSVKEKKKEEHLITELQSQAKASRPNTALLDKLKDEMNKLMEQRKAIPSKGKFVIDTASLARESIKTIDL